MIEKGTVIWMNVLLLLVQMEVARLCDIIHKEEEQEDEEGEVAGDVEGRKTCGESFSAGKAIGSVSADLVIDSIPTPLHTVLFTQTSERKR
jgi:hypothetical protein